MLQLTPQAIRIHDFYEDGKDARHFTFQLLAPMPLEKPQIGQFFMLTVPGEGLAPFTYVTPPDEHGRFSALVRKVGSLTKRLFELEKGAVLGYSGPIGNGWPLDNIIAADEILIVAGGCGLAPLAATIDYLIDTGKAQQVSVIYGAHDPQSQVLKVERARWRSKVLLFESLSSEGDHEHTGAPTKHIQHILNEHKRMPQVVLTCGPEGMMHAVAFVCKSLGIKNDAIWLSIERRMRCGVGLCGHCYIANTLACKQGPTYRYDHLLTLEEKTTPRVKHAGPFLFC